jgi:hypothetical protein
MTMDRLNRMESDHAEPDALLRRDLGELMREPVGAASAGEAAATTERLARIQSQALRDWSQWQREGLVANADVQASHAVLAGGVASLGTGPRHRSGGWWRLVAASVATLALVASWWWVNRPDPVLEELLRVDVLSMIAAGEI